MVNVRPKDPSKMIKVYCEIHRRESVQSLKGKCILRLTFRLSKSERRCIDCADMMTEPKYSFHITMLLEDESSEVLQVGLGADEAVSSRMTADRVRK
jgi:hypothetical protein